MTSIKPWTTV